MKIIYRWLNTALLAGVLGFTSTAMATTGYFALGYGAKSMGRAGAVVSSPQDSISAATNPAAMALVGERVDVGLRFFSPQREAKLETTTLGATFDVEDKSRRDLFLIPNLGFTRQINNKAWWGISMYGNGGMNSTYDRNLFDEANVVLGAFAGGGAPAAAMVPEGLTTPDLVPGTLPKANADVGTLGVDLAQVIITPTISVKLNEAHTFGLSLLVGVQRFSARGLGNFQCFTETVQNNLAANPSCAFGVADTPSKNLTNNGNDWSYGAGARVGWIGEVHPRWTLGVAAASKIYMTEFEEYKELFAEGGDFDIPANVSAGATFRATPKLSFSFDHQRIFYEGVNAVSNPGPIPSPAGPMIPPGSTALGTSKGLGFGWEDIRINRVAAEYQHNSKWTFRGGYSWNDQPIPDDQILFNFLAPATIEQHATLGFTYAPNKSSEWSFAYMHALDEKVETQMSAFGIPAEIQMYQNSVDLSYSMKF